MHDKIIVKENENTKLTCKNSCNVLGECKEVLVDANKKIHEHKEIFNINEVEEIKQINAKQNNINSKTKKK